MSMMKMLVVSTIISIPLMFMFPSDNTDFGGDQYTRVIQAGLQFSEFCNNLPARDCTTNSVKLVYSDCEIAYGNLTLEECTTKCCNIQDATESFFGIPSS